MDIQIVDDFISPADAELGIKIIKDLIAGKENAVRVWGSAMTEHAVEQGQRAVFTRPTSPEAVRLVKESAAKIAKLLPYEGAVVHDCIFVQYKPGAHIDAHMDFDDEPACKNCTHSAVVYFDDQYEGGQIYFPVLAKDYHPNARSMVVFTQRDRNYVHGVRAVTSGVRHMINLCMSKDPDGSCEEYK
jgi:hypothetical protein